MRSAVLNWFLSTRTKGCETYEDQVPDPGFEIFADPDPELDFFKKLPVVFFFEKRKTELWIWI